ncbi:hypothetical protein MTO96_045594 [Rhipicephalus appendiculatus]
MNQRKIETTSKSRTEASPTERQYGNAGPIDGKGRTDKTLSSQAHRGGTAPTGRPAKAYLFLETRDERRNPLYGLGGHRH